MNLTVFRKLLDLQQLEFSERWDIFAGRASLVLGISGLYLVQFTGFGYEPNLHRASQSFNLGYVLKTLGDARFRYRESAVWQDLQRVAVDFESGDSVFTSSSGFVSVVYKDYAPAQIFPNSLVILSAVAKGAGSAKAPVLDAKKGKVKIFLAGSTKSPRVRFDDQEYEFRAKSSDEGATVEFQLTSDSGKKSLEVYSSAEIEMKVDQSDPRSPNEIKTKQIEVKPGKPMSQDILKQEQIDASDQLVKSQKHQSKPSTVEDFIKATDRINGREKVKKEETPLEEEVMKDLMKRLKESGYDVKREK